VVSYATTTLSYQKSQALESVTLGALVATVMIPLMGLLSDKVGRQKMYTLSVVLLGLFIVPWFLLLDTGTSWGIMLATIVAFGILWAPVTAVLGTLCSEIFSANVRYTGITLGYQLGAALAGGTAPLIATGLLAKYDGDWRPVAVYLGVTVAISLLAIFCASRMKSAPGAAPPGRKAPDRRRRVSAPVSRPAALRLRGPTGEITPRGKPLIPGPVSSRPGKAPAATGHKQT
jgi:MFS family permease